MVSVIVPVYNVEGYLARCLDSILSQTYTDYEVILIDDGSRDRSGQICDRYAQLQPGKISVIHQSNQGQAAARNVGVSLAKGEWIHFVDSDDALHPQMLEHLCRAAEQSHANMAMCSAMEAESVPADFWQVYPFEYEVKRIDERILAWLCRDVAYFYWVVWGKIIKKKILMQLPQFSGRVYEDNAIVCQWLHHASEVAIINHPLYFYYKNPEGTTKRPFQIKHLDVLWAVGERIAFFTKLNYEEMKHIECENFMKTCYHLAWQCSAHKDSKALYKQFIIELRRELSRNVFVLAEDDRRHLIDIFKLLHPQFAHAVSCALHPLKGGFYGKRK